MKKLLGLIGAVQLIAVPALTVISCESNANYNTFKSWINNKESFILYIGADDCEHCQDFDKFLKQENASQSGEDILKSELNSELKDNFNESSLNTTPPDDATKNILGWSEVSQVNFHSFKYDKFTDIWNDTKSMKNIRNWVVDQYKNLLNNYAGENNQWTSNKHVDDALKQMISGNGTPIFMIIRNGKFLGVTSGFDKSTSIVDSADTLVKSFEDSWNSPSDQSLIEAAKTAIDNYKKDSEKLDINYDQVNLNNYL